MSPAIESLYSSAMQLPESDRLDLAAALLTASDPPAPELSGEAWIEELHRRSAEIESGKAVLIPLEEVLRRSNLLIKKPTNG